MIFALSGWKLPPEGKLCGREQAKAWALREVWRSEGKSDYGMCTYIASKLKKTANGRPTGAAPGVSAVKEFFDKIDIDPDWLPGKASGTRGGPKRVLRGAKVTAIVSAAKRLKAEGEEPTYPAILAACPRATLNPSTNEPVDKHLVYTVFRECCYDDDPADTWDHSPRLSQAALDLPAQERRLVFANHMLRLRHTANWFYMNIVWVDLCRSVLPRTQRKAAALALARKGMKGWQSKGSRQNSTNKRKPPSTAKLASSDTVVVWLVPMLTRGKLHIEPLPDNFPGETEGGAAVMVAKVRAALNLRFQGATPPATSFSDRGNGFYYAGSGRITVGYRNVLRAHHLKAFFGDDASIRPGQLQDLLLHETAMAWVRERLTKTRPKKPWAETVPEYHARLRNVAAHCNAKYSIENWCRELPWRVQELQNRKGDRLSK